jgi:hypothetical protein
LRTRSRERYRQNDQTPTQEEAFHPKKLPNLMRERQKISIVPASLAARFITEQDRIEAFRVRKEIVRGFYGGCVA